MLIAARSGKAPSPARYARPVARLSSFCSCAHRPVAAIVALTELRAFVTEPETGDGVEFDSAVWIVTARRA